MKEDTKLDTNLLLLNDGIEKAIGQFLPLGDESQGIEGEIDVIFELPGEDEKPTKPTISVFLYDIQEDLSQRHNETRLFDRTTGKLLPGYVHMRCCYLITYWEAGTGGGMSAPLTGPRSQAMQVMNKVMNALINNRSFDKLATYTRIMPPAEHLNSLGNFWQSLGNKPRLALSYMVTLPISLRDNNEQRVPIDATELQTTLTDPPQARA